MGKSSRGVALRVDSGHPGGQQFLPLVYFRRFLEQIPLEQLTGDAILLDVTAKCENRDYLISVDDFNSWERQHGQIPVFASVFGFRPADIIS